MRIKCRGCPKGKAKNNFQLKALLMKDKNYMKINIPGRIFSMVVNI